MYKVMNVKIAGIIAEYNPLHGGHTYHMDVTRRETGCDYIICALDGAFTQRGEPAVMDKFARVRMALEAGADAVVELPQVYALRPAQLFARGGVGVLNAAGADVLSFGTENADAEQLERLYEAVNAETTQSEIKNRLAQGKSYPRAVSEAVDSLFPTLAGLLDGPNNSLGIEYIAEIRRLNSGMRPFAVKRTAAYHDESTVFSASGVRTLLRGGRVQEAADGLPEAIKEIYDREIGRGLSDYEVLAPLALTLLRRADGERPTQNGGEGLENRLIAAAKGSATLEGLFEAVKCRRYTMARIRRLALEMLLELPLAPDTVPYLRLLGMRKTASALISEMDKRSGGRLVTDPAKLKNNDIFLAECRATDTWGLSTPDPAYRRAGREYTEGFIKV